MQGSQKYRRYTFSLTESVSAQIDSLTTAKPRLTRSDIIKAGIEALRSMPQAQLEQVIDKAKSQGGN